MGQIDIDMQSIGVEGQSLDKSIDDIFKLMLSLDGAVTVTNNDVLFSAVKTILDAAHTKSSGADAAVGKSRRADILASIKSAFYKLPNNEMKNIRDYFKPESIYFVDWVSKSSDKDEISKMLNVFQAALR